MAGLALQVAGNVTSFSGVTGVFITGGIASVYQSYLSPSASLQQSKIILEEAKERLRTHSPRRREQIEAAFQATSSEEGPKSLEDLEEQLQDLLDQYCRLKNRYDEAPFTESHGPFTKFRRRVEVLKDSAKALKRDTYATTTPFINDIEFDPSKPPRLATARPASPNSPATVSPEFELSPGHDIPLSHV